MTYRCDDCSWNAILQENLESTGTTTGTTWQFSDGIVRQCSMTTLNYSLVLKGSSSNVTPLALNSESLSGSVNYKDI